MDLKSEYKLVYIYIHLYMLTIVHADDCKLVKLYTLSWYQCFFLSLNLLGSRLSLIP